MDAALLVEAVTIKINRVDKQAARKALRGKTSSFL
jgi:hypothetical protein